MQAEELAKAEKAISQLRQELHTTQAREKDARTKLQEAEAKIDRLQARRPRAVGAAMDLRETYGKLREQEKTAVMSSIRSRRMISD